MSSNILQTKAVDAEKLKAVKQEFTLMLEKGIIRESNSEWASSLTMVQKANGKWRPCGDYRALNSITVPDRYLIPHIHNITQMVHGSVYFSKIDLQRAYNQIPMNASDIKKDSHHHTIWSI